MRGLGRRSDNPKGDQLFEEVYMCKRCETAADLLATFIENTPVMTEHGNRRMGA